MNLRFKLLSAVIAALIYGCSTHVAPVESIKNNNNTDQDVTINVITPVPPAAGHIQALTRSNIVRVWANTGGDKVTREELRASKDPNSILNSAWDGTGISLFGARNEVVAFNLVLEAPEEAANKIEVSLPTLSGPSDTEISSHPASGNEIFNYVGRNIELFYIRYLRIKGISTDLFFSGYNYDERHIPERCRRHYDQEGEGRGTWEDRPCHNHLYPDIAVPLELHTPFDIPAGLNQSIWGDVYIPKSAPPGEYTGTITIKENGLLTWEIPIQLQVYDFTLPDLPHARTMLYFSGENINLRYMGEIEPELPEKEKELTDLHFQLVHRHKISLIDSYIPVDQMDKKWLARLNGDLFTPEEGYDGVGIGTGNNVYAIGTYGEWPWMEGKQEDMWNNTDLWVEWFDARAFSTPTDYFLYLIDESDDYKQIEKWAQWMDDNPGPGQSLMSMATVDLPIAAANIPSLDIPASWAHFGISEDWQAAADEYAAAPDKRLYVYNSSRPATGSFAIEDEGIALRQIPWVQYKMGIDRWFYWEATFYDNFQCYGDEPEAQTNVFQQAQTYGCLEDFEQSLGETGWNYVNGDGVLLYPGTDSIFPEESYGVMGPFASLRLKMWRRGIQDVDYLVLAAEIDPQRTAEIVNAMIPTVLWELGVEELEDPTYLYSDISWPTDPDVWEAARAELAEIIQAASP